jgi:hypothetical protein
MFAYPKPDFGIFKYEMLVYFMAICICTYFMAVWYILWLLGVFFPFVPRQIWQPCRMPQLRSAYASKKKLD